MALMETFLDKFDTADTGLWTYPSGCSVTGGQMQIVPTSSYPTNQSVAGYDLTNSFFFMAVTALPATAGNQTYYDLIASTGNSVGWLIENSPRNLRPNYSKSGVVTNLTSATYSPTTHKFLRIRNSGSSVFWDYSADGVTWTQQATATTTTLGATIPLTALKPSPGAGFFSGTPGGNAFFDMMNSLELAQPRGLLIPT